MLTFYCLKIVRAYPDYKRPYANASVYHFMSIQEAELKRKEEKRIYYQQFLHWLENPEEIDMDKIDDECYDLCYADSYMDQEPFEAVLYEITFQNSTTPGDRIKSREIPFPKTPHLDA